MSQLILASCMQLIALSYVTSDIAKSYQFPLSYRSLESSDYDGGIDYQMFDDRLPRSDDIFNLTDPILSNYDYALPKDQTSPIRVTGDAVDIPFAQFAEGLDSEHETRRNKESTEDLRDFVNVNNPPEATEPLKYTTVGFTQTTSTTKRPLTDPMKAETKSTIAVTKSGRETSAPPKIEKEKNSPSKNVNAKKPVILSGRSLYQEDDEQETKSTDNRHKQKEDDHGKYKMIEDRRPQTIDDELFQNIDDQRLHLAEMQPFIMDTYQGWLPDGTPVNCKRSAVPFLGCQLEMYHVGELPFFYYGLALMSTNLADKVCPCPMPRLEPDCVQTTHRMARYMEHICHAYLRMPRMNKVSARSNNFFLRKGQIYQPMIYNERTPLDLFFHGSDAFRSADLDLF